ncbi:MAG: transcriptional repressor [Chloroflexi bacterium]|nr:transcriptional repressor [Chloroflexota bacterium]
MPEAAGGRKEGALGGLRLTPQRKAILAAVREGGRHPEAGEIYERVRRQLPHISLGTVYRNLAQLSEAGLVVELNIGRASRWDGQPAPHDHLICRRCGHIEDIDIGREGCDLDAIARRVSGFIIEGHRLQFEGLCPACQRRELDQSAHATDV